MSFNIVRHRGKPNEAVIKTKDGNDSGIVVTRQPGFICEAMQYQYFPCADYEEHFIFRLPQQFEGPTYQCTCGATAGVVQWHATREMPIPPAPMWQCQAMVELGHHTNLSAKWY